MPHPTPPHPTPPHHQRSIKNIRLEKEAFRDLSFRSVGLNIINSENLRSPSPTLDSLETKPWYTEVPPR